MDGDTKGSLRYIVWCVWCKNGAAWTGRKALRISELSCGVLAGGDVAHGGRLYLAQTKVSRGRAAPE